MLGCLSGQKKSCWLDLQGQQELKRIENSPRSKSGIELLDLSGVVLHHQQFVDLKGDPFALSAANHFGAELGFIEFEVGRHVGQSWELQIRFGKQFAALAFANGDHITRFALITGDVGDPSVHGDVAMIHQLTCTWHGWAKANAETNIVETILEQFEQVGSC